MESMTRDSVWQSPSKFVLLPINSGNRDSFRGSTLIPSSVSETISQRGSNVLKNVTGNVASTATLISTSSEGKHDCKQGTNARLLR